MEDKKYDYKRITINSSEYPEHLRLIPDAPEELYCIGNLDLIQKPLISMVGTRRASPYGRWVTREIGKRIAACGIPIVSGMAYGIDSEAHKACLEMGTPTVAVLGTGIDVIYPESNRRLYHEIAEKGLIISEYCPGTPATQYTFPRRNRIISGLASKVIVTEGAYKSGSMITAKLALSQGREVFAVPGNINQPMSSGVNSLIFDGAMPIINLDELLATLGIKDTQLEIAIANADPEDLKLLEIIRDNPGITPDELAAVVYEEVKYVLSRVCAMELKGLVRSEGKRLFFS